MSRLPARRTFLFINNTRMKPNATWDVQLPASRQGNGTKNRFDVLVPPLVISNSPYGQEGRQQKDTEKGVDDLFYFNNRGQESSSSFTSVSVSTERTERTEPSSRDTSKKSKSSPRDSSRRTPKSKTKRNGRRKSSSSDITATPFDPTRKPQKSCVKRRQHSSSAPGLRNDSPERKRGSFHIVHLPEGLGTIKRQRSIRFNEQVSVREVRSSKSLVRDNPKVLWWSHDETDSIKENLQRLLLRVDRHGVARSNGRRYCTRGLERFLDPDGCEDDRTEAEKAVFREQSHQRDCGTFDDLRIAAVYFPSTRTSLRRAAHRGSDDALAAQSILSENNEESIAKKPFKTARSSGSLNLSISSSGGQSPPPSLVPKRTSSFSVFKRRSRSLRHRDPEPKPRQHHKQRPPRRSQSFHQERKAAPSAA